MNIEKLLNSPCVTVREVDVVVHPYATQYGRIGVPDRCKTDEEIRQYIEEHFDYINFGEADLDYKGIDFDFYETNEE